VKAAGMWNVFPLTVRALQQFKLNLKKWFKDGQICEHEHKIG